MRYTLRHTIDTDVDTFWKLYFDHDFTEALNTHFGMRYEIAEERTDADGIFYRRVEYLGADVPAVFKRFVGDGAGVETGHFDPKTKKYVSETMPKVGGDKFRMLNEIYVEPRDGKSCERVINTENIVTVFGISKLIERFIQEPQRLTHGRVVEFINRYIKDKSL